MSFLVGLLLGAVGGVFAAPRVTAFLAALKAKL